MAMMKNTVNILAENEIFDNDIASVALFVTSLCFCVGHYTGAASSQ